MIGHRNGEPPADPDLGTFERAMAAVTPEAAARHLRSLRDEAAALRSMLRARDGNRWRGPAAADAAHALAGAAGLFGFRRICDAGARFERAARNDSADAPHLADLLVAALADAIDDLSARLDAIEA